MLDILFRRLTADRQRGAELFAAVTRLAREPQWYLDGQVPDTFDGRFAVLATTAALVLIRLEQEGDAGNSASVALTERFVEVMDSEHRELGIGDPTLGKTVRKLVGSLSRRTGRWRLAVNGEADWQTVTLDSLYRAAPPSDALLHSAEALRSLWTRLRHTPLGALEQGSLG